jgi:hypothetical protein
VYGLREHQVRAHVRIYRCGGGWGDRCQYCAKPRYTDRAAIRQYHRARSVRGALKRANRPIRHQDTHVYIIAASNGLYKIGRSRHLKTRLSGLQSSSADPLTLHSWAPAPWYYEKFLHARFLRYRVSGEWFKLSPRALRAVQAHMMEAAQEPRGVESLLIP